MFLIIMPGSAISMPVVIDLSKYASMTQFQRYSNFNIAF